MNQRKTNYIRHLLKRLSLFMLALSFMLLSGSVVLGNTISRQEQVSQAKLTCDPQIYYGIQHCGQSNSDANILVVDLKDPHVRVETVLSRNQEGEECNSVNGNDRDNGSNCPFPYPFEKIGDMLANNRDRGAVAIINTDYFGDDGDHGAQGLAVKNGVRLDGPQHGVTNSIAFTSYSLAFSPDKTALIGIPASNSVIEDQKSTTYFNTVGGSPLLVDNGQKVSLPCSSSTHPSQYGDTCSPSGQSAAGLTDDGQLALITSVKNASDLVDTLQENVSSVNKALKFDGHGSARIAWIDEAGVVRTFGGTPDPRPVAEGLLIFSEPIAGGKITISSVNGQFFPNPTNSGAFVAKLGDSVAFTQTFPVVNFNPPAGSIPCSNPTGVGVGTRPFTNVVPQSDGSCLTIPAQGNNQQAGLGDLFNFQAVFNGEFVLSSAAQVTFNFFSDDGWILSSGPNSAGKQPTYVSGALINPPQVGPFSGYSVVGSYNRGSAPTQNNLVVNFPASGTYPFELDYSECCAGELVLTLKADSQPIPAGGVITGTVYNAAGDTPIALPGAMVQACRGSLCSTTLTIANGQYIFNSMAPGDYLITAYPPANSNLLPGTIGPISLGTSETLSGQDILLAGPIPLPQGTSITNRNPGSDGIPIIYWGELLTLSTKGCQGGTASYQILQNGQVIRSGLMQEGPPGNYTAKIEPLFPQHGNARVIITIECTGGQPTNIPFDIYIDPSGFVRDLEGRAIENATVTLYRSENYDGPFSIVADGSGIMSLANRHNPDLTDISGHFGWDVVAGYYKVRVEKANCVSPVNSSIKFVETDVLVIPPPVTDLDLRLDCTNLIYLPILAR